MCTDKVRILDFSLRNISIMGKAFLALLIPACLEIRESGKRQKHKRPQIQLVFP
jgi:hypothetical protein